LPYNSSIPLDSSALLDLCVRVVFLASALAGFCLQLLSDNNSLGDLDDVGPEDKASAAAVLTFSWADKLVYAGFKRQVGTSCSLSLSDFYAFPMYMHHKSIINYSSNVFL
jgi:hypothetical protein